MSVHYKRIKNPEICHTKVQLVFDKGAKATEWRKEQLDIDGWGQVRGGLGEKEKN